MGVGIFWRSKYLNFDDILGRFPLLFTTIWGDYHSGGFGRDEIWDFEVQTSFLSYNSLDLITLPKFDMEPENGTLE